MLKRLLGHSAGRGTCKVASLVLILKLFFSGNRDLFNGDRRRSAILRPLDNGIRATGNRGSDTDR
jgi:hypothetical protein